MLFNDITMMFSACLRSFMMNVRHGRVLFRSCKRIINYLCRSCFTLLVRDYCARVKIGSGEECSVLRNLVTKSESR